MTDICSDELEQMKKDIENKIFDVYVDTWDLEDEYSHNDIDEARREFIEEANKYFEEKNFPYYAREAVENVYIYDKNTDKRLYS